MTARWNVRVAGAVLVAALTLAVAACGGGGGGDDEEPSLAHPKTSLADAEDVADDFLAKANGGDLNGVCALFSAALLERLAPGSGDCETAIRALTVFTGAGEANTLAEKKVDKAIGTETSAVVILVDKITGEGELPIRVVVVNGGWRIDEFGDGARLAQACIEEQQATAAAVDEYLTDNDDFPPDAKALVPGYLPVLPPNHTVDSDGNVTPIGVCA